MQDDLEEIAWKACDKATDELSNLKTKVRELVESLHTFKRILTTGSGDEFGRFVKALAAVEEIL